MNQYVTGAVIRKLREKSGMTQVDLAQVLSVSDKTVSKWETGKGYPDITLLEPIADAFRISVTELLSGNPIRNENVSANMLRSKFYVCPICGNVIHSMGEAAIQCHGVLLSPLEAEPAGEPCAEPAGEPCTEQTGSMDKQPTGACHAVSIQRVEDEYFVRIEHEMTKNHYISFIAAASPDDMQLLKLYPEGAAEARFRIRGVRRIYFYCNRDGLFTADVVKK